MTHILIERNESWRDWILSNSCLTWFVHPVNQNAVRKYQMHSILHIFLSTKITQRILWDKTFQKQLKWVLKNCEFFLQIKLAWVNLWQRQIWKLDYAMKTKMDYGVAYLAEWNWIFFSLFSSFEKYKWHLIEDLECFFKAVKVRYFQK